MINSVKKIGKSIAQGAVDLGLTVEGEVGDKLASKIGKGRLGSAIGGGVSLGLGAAAVGVAGGAVYGAVSDEESIAGGVSKGALGGAALGLTTGAISGAVHKNSSILTNAAHDLDVAASILHNGGVKAKDGIKSSPIGSLVKPGSAVDYAGTKIGEEVSGQMRFLNKK